MNTLSDRNWRLIREEARPGPMNMALDEIAAETAAAGGPRTVRVYRWEPSCLSLGYGQDPDTVEWSFCETNGIDVTRRQTGGGGIYHDREGDVSYSIVAPTAELPGDLMECYGMLCAPILECFDRLGVDADFADTEAEAIYEPACYLRSIHPAHDIVVDERKVSGNAQYRQSNAVIQHGSLTYRVDAETHLGVFDSPTATSSSFRDRVTGIGEHTDADRQTVVETLETVLGSWADCSAGNWTEDELADARALAETKYADPEWVRRTSPADDR